MNIDINTLGLDLARTNIVLFIEHFLKYRNGVIKIIEAKTSIQLYDKILNFLRHIFDTIDTSADFQLDSHNTSLSKLQKKAKFLYRELKLVRYFRDDTLKSNSQKKNNILPEKIVCEKVLGIDFTGALHRDHMSNDDLNIHFLSLCYVQKPLPRWFIKTSSLLDYSPQQVAQQITLLLYDQVYRHIRPEMMINSKTRTKSIHVTNMVRFFKVLSWWPLTTILGDKIKFQKNNMKKNKLKNIDKDFANDNNSSNNFVNRKMTPLDRQSVFIYFITMAEEFRSLNNFHCLFAVTSGLIQPFVSWIWELLDPKEKQRFNDLKRVVSSDNDYLIYKADISKCQNKSHIPFLGLTNKLLIPLENRIKYPNHNHLINFQRLISIYGCVKSFLQGQHHPYSAKSGESYLIFDTPPGASAYVLSSLAYEKNASYIENVNMNEIMKKETFKIKKSSITSHTSPKNPLNSTELDDENYGIAKTLSKSSKPDDFFNISSPWDVDDTNDNSSGGRQGRGFSIDDIYNEVLNEQKKNELLSSSAFRVKSITDGKTSGSIQLLHNDDLQLLLAYLMSTTKTEDQLKKLAQKQKEESDKHIMKTLETAGFL